RRRPGRAAQGEGAAVQARRAGEGVRGGVPGEVKNKRDAGDRRLVTGDFRTVSRCLLPVSCIPLFFSGIASAQTSLIPHSPDFSAARLPPAPGPAAFYQVEEAQIGTAFGLVTSLESRPLVIRDVAMQMTLTDPVSLRLGLDLTGSYAFGRFQLGVGLPLVAFQSGDRLPGLHLGEPAAQGA